MIAYSKANVSQHCLLSEHEPQNLTHYSLISSVPQQSKKKGKKDINLQKAEVLQQEHSQTERDSIQQSSESQ